MEKFGNYNLLEKLGYGGMAEVFRAQRTGGLGINVVVKRILSHLTSDSTFKEDFKREAALASTLDHSNIVKTTDYGEVDGEQFIELEYVQGTDLRECLLISRLHNRPFSLAESVLIAIEVCRGLAYAHGELSNGSEAIIHRDISPHNILLSGKGDVKISDFGIARLADSETIRQGGGLTGKIRYMSPEQISEQKLDVKTDVFSFGVVLWEMLSGRPLFDVAGCKFPTPLCLGIN